MPELKKFYQGEVIFEEGQEGDTVYVIRSGSVEISLTRENKKVVLARLGDGNCFGEMASVSSAKRSAAARALTYSEVYTLNASALEARGETIWPHWDRTKKQATFAWRRAL